MLKKLVEYIQLYRQHNLFIPETKFHREICRSIQAYVVQMNDIAKKKGASLYSSHGGSQMVMGSQMTFSTEASWDSPADSGAIRRIREKITGLLPDHHYWQGSIFQFIDTSIPDIMEQLIYSGFLDCSVPNAMYTIAGKVIKRPFGMTTVRIVVGYVADILGTELSK